MAPPIDGQFTMRFLVQHSKQACLRMFTGTHHLHTAFSLNVTGINVPNKTRVLYTAFFHRV